MTNKQFSKAFDQHIIGLLFVRQLANAGSWAIADRVFHDVQYDANLGGEGHDFDAIHERVKLIMAQQRGPTGNNQNTGTSQSAGTSTGTSTGTSGWRQAWSNFTSSTASAASAWVGSARSAWSSGAAWGRTAWAGFGGGGGRGGRGGGGRGRGPSNRFRFFGGGYRARGTGKGGGGGRGGHGGRGASGAAPRQPWPTNMWSHTTAGRAAAGAAAAHRGTDWTPGSARIFDPAQYFNLMPNARGMFGSLGGMAGAGAGSSTGAQSLVEGMAGGIGGKAFGRFAGAFAMPIGQTIGTHIGNLIDKFKEITFHAHEFATALKESNKRFVYYNASISMSYIESDIQTLIRDMRISRAIAPNAVNLNRAITTFENTSVDRTIFTKNIKSDVTQFGMGIQQGFAEGMQPFFQVMNVLRETINPGGAVGEGMGGFLGRTAVGLLYMMLPSPWAAGMAANSFVGAMLGLNKPPDMIGGGPMANLINNPARTFREIEKVGDVMVNQRIDPKNRFGARRRF